MFVTVNVHFLFRSDENLIVNENNIIFVIKDVNIVHRGVR